jgi:hypothetical protein
MAREIGSSAHQWLARIATGDRVSGFTYGTVVALASIAAGARAFPGSPGRVAVVVAATCGLLWLAHVYAHGLGQSITRGEHLSLHELRHIAHHEWAIVEAAALPVVALLLGSLGLFDERTAVWLAFGLGLGILVAQGVVFARAERLGWLGTLAILAANLGLGLALVALKLFLSH